MSYISPNSTIRLFNNVPLDNSYRNTLYFDNVSVQEGYFASAAAGIVATLQNQSYQRVTAGVCRLEIPYSQAYSVNYMAFKNTSFENKWFYAFVLDVSYINDSVVEITYELDVMQSFLFDVDLLPCLVEREHINKSDDLIGANILPEQFDPGEYKVSAAQPILPLENYCVILGMVDDKSSQFAGTDSITDVGLYDATLPLAVTAQYNGVYSGVKYYAFNADDPDALEPGDNFVQTIDDLTRFINEHIDTVDNIVTLYMCPKYITPTPNEDGSIDLDYQSEPFAIADVTLGISEGAAPAFDGYMPVNKKLWTYPYNYFGVSNGQGDGLVLRYEFFARESGKLWPRFEVTSTFVDPVTLVARPIYYKNSGSEPDMNESLTLTGFPLCTWSYDTYSRWVSSQLPREKRARIQNIALGLLGAAGAGAALLMTGGMAGVAAGAVAGAGIMKGINIGTDLIRSTSSLYEKRYEAAIAQDPLKGNSANGNADFASRKMCFWQYRGHVSGEVAKMIDNYFSVFGYQTNEVKIPNRTGRTIWNYVKTANCTLAKRPAGKVNASDISQIEKIYDSGITFWHDPLKVGDYSAANMAAN